MQQQITLIIEVTGTDDVDAVKDGLVLLFTQQLTRLTETATVVGYDFPDEGVVPVPEPVNPVIGAVDANPHPEGTDALHPGAAGGAQQSGVFRSNT